MTNLIVRRSVIAQPSEARRLLTLKEAADLLNVSVPTLRRRIAEGALKCVRIGKQIRIRPADLEAFVKASEASGPSESLTFLR